MSMRKWVVTVSIFTMAFVAAPRTASADWVLTPFFGGNFGGSADVNGTLGGATFSNKFERKLDYGASLAGMGKGALGFEVDFGYSPNFFETAASSNNFQFTNDSNVTTLTGNLIIGAPVGSIRPYVVGGVGLIRTKLQDVGALLDINTKNDFGIDVGGGLMGFFTQNIGLRGDLRYFRGFRGTDDNATGLALGDFKFWRGSLGLSIKF